MSLILGIDPGLASLGWAVVLDGRKPELVDCGVIKTLPEFPIGLRLSKIALDLGELMLRHQPDCIGMEDYTWHGGQKDARTAEVLGVIAGVAAMRARPVYRCQPQQWRKHLGISRSATKADVKDVLRVRLGWELPNQHAADAAAVALWAASQALTG